MTKGDVAVEKFQGGFNCAQSVLTSFAEELGVDSDLAARMATGFGGGMGREQEVCGAVSGAVLALGLRHGRGSMDGKDKQDANYRKVQALFDAFSSRFGTVLCRELLPGCALLTEEGQKTFREKNLVLRCHDCVREACGILETLL